MICARIFLVPLVEALLGASTDVTPIKAVLTQDLEANGERQHYMRATVVTHSDGRTYVTPAHSQDSSLVSTLAQSNCLIVRTPGAPPLKAGQETEILALDF